MKEWKWEGGSKGESVTEVEKDWEREDKLEC